MALKIDPEFQALIQPLTPEEYQLLKQNIQNDGCRDPIVVWNGLILDGHNRYKICTELNLKFQTTELKLADRTEALIWIIKNQLGRRNLDTPTKIELALKLKPLIASKAKEHQKSAGKEKALVNIDQSFHTRTELAKTANTSTGTITKAEKIINDAPEIWAEVKAGNKSINQAYNDVRREEKRTDIIANLENINTKKVKELEGVFDAIVIDPPWPMQRIERETEADVVEMPYPTMSEAELKSLKIPYATDCHVWLWTTHKFIPMAFRLLDTWGLKYVCMFVWHKPGGFQPFGLPMYNCEFAIYARRGVPEFIDFKNFMTCFEAKRTGHSEKPQEFYDMVKRVTAGRRLDMFNRRKIDGFETYGKEAK